VGLLDHQVGIQVDGGQSEDGFHDKGAEGQVWYEVTVHDVQVKAGGANLFHQADLLAQVGEIGAKETR